MLRRHREEVEMVTARAVGSTPPGSLHLSPVRKENRAVFNNGRSMSPAGPMVFLLCHSDRFGLRLSGDEVNERHSPWSAELVSSGGVGRSFTAFRQAD